MKTTFSRSIFEEYPSSPESRPADETPLVTVVVVNYNGQEHLDESLSALCADRSFPRTEILVVDNASTDGSLEIAQGFAVRQTSEVFKTSELSLRVLRSPVNRGYAGGVNLSVGRARGKYLAVLNMDVTVSPGWLVHMIGFLEAHPEVGAASPLIVLAGDEQLVNAVGQDIHVTGLGFNRGLSRPRSDVGLEPVRVSGIHGGAFVIRRALLEQMGGWDESGFLYHEDVELSWLLRLMGHDLYCVPRSVVRHNYVLTMYPEKLFLLERNRCAMLLAQLETASLFLLAPFLVFTEALMWCYCLLRGRAFLKAKAASYRWLIRQRNQIRTRKAFVRSIRRRSDLQVLAGSAWGYAWDQFLTLGRERD